MNVKVAPIKENFLLESGENNPLWMDFLNGVGRMLGAKRNQQSIEWTPTATGLSFSGAGTLTATYTQKDNLVYFNLVIDPGAGTSTAILDTSKITNLPRKSDGYWCGVVIQQTGKVNLGTCFIDSGTTELYLPSWSCTGKVIVSGNYLTSE